MARPKNTQPEPATETQEQPQDDLNQEIERLRAELAIAQIDRDNWQQLAEGQAEIQAPELEGDEDLFYCGIKHPDYRLKTVYVPYNAKGVSKNVGYDADTGESYHYTSVKIAHCPPGQENHRMEEYRVRLDARVIVPAFVAHALDDRADTQDYYPEE